MRLPKPIAPDSRGPPRMTNVAPMESSGAGPESPIRRTFRVLAVVLQSVLFVGYPLAVYLAYTRLEPRTFGLVLLSLYALSVLSRFGGSWAGGSFAASARRRCILSRIFWIVVSASLCLAMI